LDEGNLPYDGWQRQADIERVARRHSDPRGCGKRFRGDVAPELEERIRKALATPGRPGVRKIAERFGVDPGNELFSIEAEAQLRDA